MSVSYGMSAEAGLFDPSYIPQSIGQRLTTRPDMSNDYVNKGTKYHELSGAFYNKVYPYYNSKTYEEITKHATTAPNIPGGDAVPQNIKFGRTYLGSGIISQMPTSGKLRY
jgi:hypothetical protein